MHTCVQTSCHIHKCAVKGHFRKVREVLMREKFSEGPIQKVVEKSGGSDLKKISGRGGSIKVQLELSQTLHRKCLCTLCTLQRNWRPKAPLLKLTRHSLNISFPSHEGKNTTRIYYLQFLIKIFNSLSLLIAASISEEFIVLCLVTSPATSSISATIYTRTPDRYIVAFLSHKEDKWALT